MWITGAGGLIGSYIARLAPTIFPDWGIISLTRGVLDLTDFSAVEARFNKEKPACIVHCAALSKTQECQANPGLAHHLNAKVTDFLAGLAQRASFLFLSTDLVFDGTRGDYEEEAAVNPLGVYGQTKVAAETMVLKNPNHTVVRTSLNAGISPTGDRGFNELMRAAWEKGETLSLFTDELRCPIPAALTARGILELIRSNRTGIYHLAGSEKLSRYEMGVALAARWPHLKPRIRPSSLAEYGGAPRSPNTSLCCKKVQPLLSFQLPAFTTWLAEHGDELI
jgi:dTDP-4-dehydrorhamnose reductase